MELLEALRILHKRGYRDVRANTVADVLWPNARHHNSRGQVFNLSSGVAGKMLRRSELVHEVRNREFEIIVEKL